MSTSRDAGIAALKSGDLQSAAKHLEEAVRESPDDAQAHGYLGTAYAQLGDSGKALQALGEASRLAPSSAPLRYNLGMAQERAGKGPEALESYRQALKLDGSYERARQALVRLGEAPPAAPGPAPV